MKYFLFDLRVIVIGNPATYNCSHKIGEGFEILGENFSFIEGTSSFSHFAFATLMPYIAAKQRVSDVKDWMYYENSIACPDPLCGARFKIERLERRTYEYGDA